ncbi:MAG: prephenate dehydratase, partial [Thermoproteota archaeon]|nr:prephenate dehydratase [Thermoproteota archaeon]
MVKIGFQGESGSYSEIAALRYFSNLKPSFIPFRSLQDLFDNVENSFIDAAIVPIENSIEGSVNETYDLLVEKHLFVTGEIYQRIRHCLIVNKQSDETKTVFSHPQALAQCRNYIRKKSLEPIPSYDTAGSVKFIKEHSLVDASAIASKRAAEIYDMKIIEEGIEDKNNNFTRFLVISKIPNNQTNTADKTSIIFSISHTPGSLFLILKEFATRNINLTRIESRPTKDIPWEYYFFVDFEGNPDDDVIKTSLLDIKKETLF